MRVAFLNPQGNFDPEDTYWTKHPDFGGQLVYVKELAIAMASMGVKADIITRRIEDAEWPEFSREVDGYPGIDNLRIVRAEFGGKQFLRKEFLWPHLSEYVEKILQFYDQEKTRPNFITTHYGDGGIAGAMMAKTTGIPYSFTAHSLGAQKMEKLRANKKSFSELDKEYNFTARIRAEGVSMKYSAVNFVSTSMERFEQYGHRLYEEYINVNDDDKFCVAPPGVNTDVFHSETMPEDDLVEDRIGKLFARFSSRQRVSLPMIVSSSRLDKKKNHVSLLRAYMSSKYLKDNVNLIIVTSGVSDPYSRTHDALQPEREVLNNLVDIVRRSNLKDRVLFADIRNQKELASLYRLAARRNSVFCLTALYEPFGLAPLEAMACGLPAVVTKNGGPSESLKDSNNEYGVLVDPTDVDDIKDGLLSLLGPERRDRLLEMRALGERRVLSRYTWQATAEKYLGEIEKKLCKEFEEPVIPEWFFGKGKLLELNIE
ncbi:MAG TPA: glycosyltransferase family 1 protein [Kosmotogaceae bacterium]|nr:glycosyltransferase family 1 protein [Kosmotogaceae bacterium]